MVIAKAVGLTIQGFNHRAPAGCAAAVLLGTLAVGMSPPAHAVPGWVQLVAATADCTTFFFDAPEGTEMWDLQGTGNAPAPPNGLQWNEVTDVQNPPISTLVVDVMTGGAPVTLFPGQDHHFALNVVTGARQHNAG